MIPSKFIALFCLAAILNLCLLLPEGCSSTAAVSAAAAAAAARSGNSNIVRKTKQTRTTATSIMALPFARAIYLHLLHTLRASAYAMNAILSPSFCLFLLTAIFSLFVHLSSHAQFNSSLMAYFSAVVRDLAA
jgi:hypothetical protein